MVDFTVFGTYADQAEALGMAWKMNREDRNHSYQRHPDLPNVVIQMPKGRGIKVLLIPPDPKLFAYLERTYGKGHVEYLGLGQRGGDLYFCIKPDRSGGVYYTDQKGVGRQMTTDSRAKDALVVGDDSEVYENFIADRVQGVKTAPEEHAVLEFERPSQEDYNLYWDDVYEATGARVRGRADEVNLHSEMGDHWYVEGRNMGWRSQHGYNLFEVRTYERKNRAVGFEFLNHILPHTDNTFYIYDDENGHGLIINNFQHDSGPGGEVYECLPVEYMIAEGMWWGINLGREDILPEIHDVLMAEWEFEFLNKELAAPEGGQLMVLDIEFPSYYRKFLARYKLTPENKYHDLTQIRGDLGEFFERHYSERVEMEFEQFLGATIAYRGFKTELEEFLRDFNLTFTDVPQDKMDLLRKTYEEVTG